MNVIVGLKNWRLFRDEYTDYVVLTSHNNLQDILKEGHSLNFNEDEIRDLIFDTITQKMFYAGDLCVYDVDDPPFNSKDLFVYSQKWYGGSIRSSEQLWDTLELLTENRVSFV